ncbi:PilZ domain-containing protein [Sporosarcina sp. CAU 1771]
MYYKRAEYFRYTFGEPLEAKFRILLVNGTRKESKLGHCTLIDLSPGGARLFAEFDIPLEGNPIQLHLSFTLYESQIDVEGTIVWKKPTRNGYLYGFEIVEDELTEELIVNELKLRRRSEFEEKSKRKK